MVNTKPNKSLAAISNVMFFVCLIALGGSLYFAIWQESDFSSYMTTFSLSLSTIIFALVIKGEKGADNKFKYSRITAWLIAIVLIGIGAGICTLLLWW